MKLPGERRLAVQTLGRRDPSIVTSGARAVRAETQRGNSELLRGAQFKRGAAQENLRAAGYVHDPFEWEVRTIRARKAAQDQINRATIMKGEARAQMYQGLGKAAFGIAQLSIDNQVAKIDRQTQEASAQLQKADADFQKQFGGRDFFSGDELTGSVATTKNQSRSQIPASEVYPKMLEDHFKDRIKETASLIENDLARRAWVMEAEATALVRVTNASVKANQAYQKEVKAQQVGEFNSALQDGNTTLAMTIANNMLAPESEKEEYREKARIAGEVNIYENVIAEQDYEGIQEALSHLMQPYEEYKEKGGHLSPDQRQIVRASLSREKARIDALRNAKTSADYSAVKGRMERAKKQMLEGIPVDTKLLFEINEQIVALQGQTGGTNREDLVEWNIVMDASDLIAETSKHGFNERERLLEEFRTAGQGHTYFNEVYRIARANHKAQTKNERNDLIGTAIEVGHKVTPLDLENPVESLKQRMTEYQELSSIYGVKGSILSDDEAFQLGEVFKELTARESVEVYTTVYEALGERESLKFFEHVGLRSDSNVGIIGEMVTRDRGNVDVARILIEGDKFLAENKDEYSPIRTDVRGAIIDTLSDLYTFDPIRHGAIKNAAESIYVGLAFRNGTGFETVDEDLAERAVEMANGPILNHAGNAINAPSFDMDQDTFEEILEYRYPLYEIENSGGVQGMSPSELLEGLRNEKFTMQSIGPGEYLIKAGGIPLAAKDGSAFIMNFNNVDYLAPIVRSRIGVGFDISRMELNRKRREAQEASIVPLENRGDGY